jgi:hypothetical protein
MNKPLLIGVALASTILLVACAPAVLSTPAAIQPRAGPPAEPELRMKAEVSFRLSSGYSRVIAAGSRWRAVGRLPEGDVYRPVDSVFSIEGRQVHEAYLVIEGAALRGFYLPGEARYSPLDKPVQLSNGALQ